jgi:type IV fimbrial biogenesis protein FimT/type IV fimbrial biogenesis protein FimU
MNARGFGLAELLVVVAVIGMISAVGYPYVATYLRTASLRAGAQELAAVINGARQLAIARNTNVCVTLSGTRAQYRTGTSAACAGGTLFVGTGTAADGTISLSNDMQITAASANVVFSALGAAVTAGTYTVHNPASGANLSVVVAASGRVRIQ